MTVDEYIEIMKEYTRRIDYIMEDFNAGLMSASEAQRMIRDNHYEREGFTKAVRMCGLTL